MWLAAILLLALALRLPVLNGPLWYDEILTLQTHVSLAWDSLLTSYSMNHHYLHNIAVKLCVDLFGDAPWAVRLPALLFGLLGIAAMWRLARDAAGSLTAHATALLLALSYHHIWFSTNARGYTGLALFSTLGLIWFLRGLKTGRMHDWLWFAATLAATVFTHLTGVFFFATLGLVWLVLLAARAVGGTLRRADVLLPATGFAVGGLATLALYAPVIPSLLQEIGQVAGTSAADPMQEYQNPLWAAYEGLRTGLGEAGAPVVLVGLLALSLALIGAVRLHRTAPLIAPVTFAHISLTIAVLLAVGMRIWPRFFFTDIPLVLFLIIVGVRAVCDRVAAQLPTQLGRALFPLALVAMAILSAGLAARNYAAPKQDLAGAVGAVEGARLPGERIFAISYSGKIFNGHFGTDWQEIWTAADYERAKAEPGPMTIIVTFPARNLREYPAIAADKDSGYLAERAYLPGTLGDGGILILSRPG
jgi:hypothetical protein